jgi:zinc protease
MRQWYAEKVLKPRRVLAIFGDVDFAQAQSLAKQYLGGGAKIDSTPAARPTDQLRPIEGDATIKVTRVEVQKTEQELAGVVIGFNSQSAIGRPSNFPLTVADTMTSGFGYPTGYLFDTLRGRGLVYDVQAADMAGRSAELTGTFYVYAGCDPANVNEVINLILENIARCQGTPADMQPDWFERSKQLVTTGEAMSNETPAQQATTAALDELYGLGYDFHLQFAERINAVTIDQVRQIARARLNECVVTVSTPQPQIVKRDTGTRTYKSFPPVDLTPRGIGHDSGK